jgi:hypothetical protein
MKRYLAIVIFILFGTIVFAQKGNWDVGIRGGLNIATLAEYTDVKNQKAIYTPSFYLTTDYEVIKYLRLEYSLGYIEKGNQFEYRVRNGMPPVIEKVNYLSNQIAVKGRFGEKILVMPKIGFSFDRAIAYDFIVVGYPDAPFTVINGSPDNYNSWNNGLMFGLDLRFQIGKRMGVEISSQFIKGLEKLSDQIYVSDFTEVPTNFLLLAGVTYSIISKEKGR